jgi:HEAT repeat protein
MAPNRIAVLLASVLLTAQAAKPEPSMEELTRRLRSDDQDVRVDALVAIGTRGAVAAPAIPAIVEMLRRVGSFERSARYACDIFRNVGLAAAPALPVLVEFSTQQSGIDSELVRCKEDLVQSAGPAILPQTMAAIARVARGYWSPDRDAGDMAFFVTENARAGFAGPVRAFGPTAIKYLEAGLGDRDPFVRAEAAGFIEYLDLPVGKRLLPALRSALKRERHAYPRSGMQWVIDRLEERPLK